MSTAISKTIPRGSGGASPSQGPIPLELMGPFPQVPSLGELERLTAIPDRRVVYRGVDWSFYEQLVDSIPDSSKIHVDYDGKDLEVMGIGPHHGWAADTLGFFVKVVAGETGIPRRPMGETTWKRPAIARGLQSDCCFYFEAGKLAAAARAHGTNDVSAFPNPDLAIEIDISEPAVDRAGIYAALRVPEIWRFDGRQVVIERLTPDGTYIPVDASLFLPIRAEDIRRWIIDEDPNDETAWEMRLRAELRSKAKSSR
jgi:Uma2 family endonuclease